MENSQVEKLIIIGSGPAGLTAAIYAARGGLNPLVISGRQVGGQLMLTTDVDDYPGFDEGIQGPDLMTKMRAQAGRFGTRFVDQDVFSVDLKSKPFTITTEDQKLQTNTLIVATGASAKWLGLESEWKFIGKGVSACAVCDGFFFKEKEVIVVGGGDTAMREAQHLSKMSKKVFVVHRRGELRAQDALQKLVKSKQNIEFILNSEIVEVLGEEKVTGVNLKNTQTGQITKKLIDGVFVAIGHSPNTKIFDGQLELDHGGYIVVHDEVKTSVDGVFAAGDVADHMYRQAATAAGSGTKAAFEVEHFLESAH